MARKVGLFKAQFTDTTKAEGYKALFASMSLEEKKAWLEEHQ